MSDDATRAFDFIRLNERGGVDHSQIVQLECLRAGIWGTKSVWGRVVTYRDAGHES